MPGCPQRQTAAARERIVRVAETNAARLGLTSSVIVVAESEPLKTAVSVLAGRGETPGTT